MRIPFFGALGGLVSMLWGLWKLRNEVKDGDPKTTGKEKGG